MPRYVPRNREPAPPSRVAVLSAIVCVVMLLVAAVILVSDTDASTQRIGLLVGVVGTIIPALLAALKSDQAASQTDGTLDERIHNGVLLALANRAAEAPKDRASDQPGRPRT